MNVQSPLPVTTAVRAVARCVVTTAALLARHRVHLPTDRVGTELRFADGTSAPVYRETVVDRPSPAEACLLVVEFRLRAVRGRGHAVFRRASLLNIPLFVGFPGFVSKLWLAHDAHGTYRGVYEWDGAGQAEAYARALWRVLALVSSPGSIHYRVVAGIRRTDLLADPARLASEGPARGTDWWRLVDVA